MEGGSRKDRREYIVRLKMKRTLNTLYIWFADAMITGSKFWIRLRYHVPPLVPSRFHLGVRRSIERGVGWVHANDTRQNVQMRHAGGWTRLEGDMIDGEEGWRGMRNKQTPHDYTWTTQINNKLSRLAYIVKGLMRNTEHWRSNMAGKRWKPTCGAHPSGRRSAD